MKEITINDLLDRLHPDQRGEILDLYENATTEALVLFENVNMSSPYLGDAAVVAVGPSLTYKNVEALEGMHLNDLPSERKHATSYVRRKSVDTISDSQ